MICEKCEKEIPDDSTFCPLCGAPVKQSGTVEQTIPNYLIQAIVVTVLCCLPTGIAAIVFAAQVNGKLQSGDLEGARNASRQAKRWCWISFGVGIVVTIIYFIIGFFSGLQQY